MIDAASFLAGPAAATVLADFGAEVVKIESLSGDPYRTLKGNFQTDYNWLLTSRNKKSLAVDLKRKEGQDILQRLAAKADVFISNFFGDQLKRYRIDYPLLSKLNPRLIFAQVSGYGLAGNEAGRRSFDATAWWARSGLMESMRHQHGDPVAPAPGMGDQATSMSMFGVIAAALYRRERTGRGGYVSTSLYANGIWNNGMALQAAIAGLDFSARRQSRGSHNPFISIYRTADDGYMFLNIVNPAREWPWLALALGHAEWTDDERFQDVPSMIRNRHELLRLLADAFSGMSAKNAERELLRHEVTFSRVVPTREVVNDPQALANDCIVPAEPGSEDYSMAVNSPVEMEGEPKRAPGRAPDIGAHSQEVLHKYLGMPDVAIEKLVGDGVIGVSSALSVEVG